MHILYTHLSFSRRLDDVDVELAVAADTVPTHCSQVSLFLDARPSTDDCGTALQIADEQAAATAAAAAATAAQQQSAVAAVQSAHEEGADSTAQKAVLNALPQQ